MNQALDQHFNKRKLVRFTLPTMVAMLIASAYSVVDGLFVSNLVGKTALASVTIVTPFIIALSTLGIMMGAGGEAVVGQLLGARRQQDANRAFSLIAGGTFAAGTACAVAGILFMDDVVRLLGASEEMASLSALYGRIAFVSMPMFMLTYVFEMFSVASGKPQLGLISSIVSGVVNIVLDAVLIAGAGMGVAGAAIATCVAEYASGLLLLFLYATGRAGTLRLVRPEWKPQILTRSLSNGVSEMVGAMASSVISLVYNRQLMSLFGENGVASFAVIEYAAMLIGAAMGGLAGGMAPLMSFQHGAGNNREKRSLFRNGLALMLMMGFFSFAASQLLARPIASAFTGYNPELMNATVDAFRIYSVAFLLIGVSGFGSSMFTAVENGKVSAVISFVRTFVFELGAVIVLPLILGPNGIWWSISAAEAAASILTVALIARLGRRYGWLGKDSCDEVSDGRDR